MRFEFQRRGDALPTIKAKGEADWISVPLHGDWFPDAFAACMANLRRFVSGEDNELVASVEDAWTTMALVEAEKPAERASRRAWPGPIAEQVIGPEGGRRDEAPDGVWRAGIRR